MKTVTLFLHAENSYMYLVSVDGTQENEKWLGKTWCDLTLLDKGKLVTKATGGWGHGRPTAKKMVSPTKLEDGVTIDPVFEDDPTVKPASYEFQVDDYLAAHLK